MADLMILAAGLGTRMKSNLAKVLHQLGGRPLISYAINAALGIAPEVIYVIVGHQAEEVERAAREQLERAATEIIFVRQAEQLGTGHAVMAARDLLRDRPNSPLIVMAGDSPLLRSQTLERLLEAHIAARNDATLLTAIAEDPTGYGRIVRAPDGKLLRIVEQRDASREELAIREINAGVYCFQVPALLEALDQLKPNNAQQEYYLTDVPQLMLARGKKVGTLSDADPEEVLGVNTRLDLAELERRLNQRKLRELMLAGVTIVDPNSTYIGQDVHIGQDTIIFPQVIIEGRSRIGNNCTIQSWTRLKDVEIGDHVLIKNSCVIEDSRISSRASIGPFARLRMDTEIGQEATIGNFVEVKKSKIGRQSKAQHLAYLGDATLGERVNIGAGTVTCNYDGARKHETIIEDDVKIGSDTMLVAPVRVGRGSVTGAGAVVIDDIPPDSLAVGVPAKIKKKLK
jgi:bifunctional UDP-N-acetylglucosamine pyrophosphorylase/glucosamine-1-phosphate N-acetyltransferase